MPFEIVLAPQAIEGLKALRADFQSSVRDAIELYLRHEPTKLSKSRIKRLRGLDRPHYRLRVNEVRVFYDVTATAVEGLAIIPQEQAEGGVAGKGAPPPPRGPRQRSRRTFPPPPTFCGAGGAVT